MWQLGWVAANDGNVSVRLEDGTILCTPTGVSKGEITPEIICHIALDGMLLDGCEHCAPSSEMKMHLRCYQKREDVNAVVHAHPPGATGFAIARRPMDMYNAIESVVTIGCVPVASFSLPSTPEVPDSIEPFLPNHDAILLANHGALTMGVDLLTAFYRMESIELWAKATINAIILGGSVEIEREKIDKLIDLRDSYGITGRHPGYKKYNSDGTLKE